MQYSYLVILYKSYFLVIYNKKLSLFSSIFQEKMKLSIWISTDQYLSEGQDFNKIILPNREEEAYLKDLQMTYYLIMTDNLNTLGHIP